MVKAMHVEQNFTCQNEWFKMVVSVTVLYKSIFKHIWYKTRSGDNSFKIDLHSTVCWHGDNQAWMDVRCFQDRHEWVESLCSSSHMLNRYYVATAWLNCNHKATLVMMSFHFEFQNTLWILHWYVCTHVHSHASIDKNNILITRHILPIIMMCQHAYVWNL